MNRIKIGFTLNGKDFSMEIEPGETLLEIIRKRLGQTGAKKGCGVGECGACTVLVEGRPVDSCIYLGIWANGKNVRTVEGLAAKDGNMSVMQDSYIEHGAVQCGFCTPGFLMSATAMKENGEKYTREEVKRALSGNFCRCTGYKKIIEATEKGLDS
jgi:carbon-monoxide dehydrogenase small subunit